MSTFFVSPVVFSCIKQIILPLKKFLHFFHVFLGVLPHFSIIQLCVVTSSPNKKPTASGSVSVQPRAERKVMFPTLYSRIDS